MIPRSRFAVVVLSGSVLLLSLTDTRAPVLSDSSKCDTYYPLSEPGFLDPLPRTEFAPPRSTFPDRDDLRLIGRMAEGILAYKRWRTPGKGIYWMECGSLYETEEDLQNAAAQWAYHIVRVARRFELNPWGLAGVCFHESGDRCGIGPHPRKWAYKTKAPWGGTLLKPSKKGISHSREEILRMLDTPKAKVRWRQTGMDLGPGQLLSRYYPDRMAEMLSLDPGLDMVGEKLRYFGRVYRTERPWSAWRGKILGWYDRRVTLVARRMGASADEIGRPVRVPPKRLTPVETVASSKGDDPQSGAATNDM